MVGFIKTLKKDQAKQNAPVKAPNAGFSHPLSSIEDVDGFYTAINRHHLTKQLSESRPYTYWSIELYDQKNGIRGGGGLGILAADMRRVAEQSNVPFVLITPFYPSEQHQHLQEAENGFTNSTSHKPLNYQDYGFKYVDTVNIRTAHALVNLDVIEKKMGSTRIICITEPGFGELYSGASGGDHRLYQEVALGFGGYQALKLAGLKPAIMQLNEVATFFAALARLDELASSGMDFYEAMVYTRKHTLYTNHTLVQAAEAEFSYDQFERFVFPNLKSNAVKKWLSDKFQNGHVKLSTITIEVAEMRSGVSKLHARVANYRDLAGEKVKFRAVTNGIDIPKWTAPNIIDFYQTNNILDKYYLPKDQFEQVIDQITADQIRRLKTANRKILNLALKSHPNQYGQYVSIPDDALVVEFKRRFVNYKRPWLPFTDPERLAQILEKNNAYYLFAGRVHEGDHQMAERLSNLLRLVKSHPVLKRRVFYFPDYDEDLSFALSVGSNISINVPIVGLEACGTSWMKDIINLNILISTADGGVADCSSENYYHVAGRIESDEIASLYQRLEDATGAWSNDFELEYIIKKELSAYLPVISGSRMLKDYLEYIF